MPKFLTKTKHLTDYALSCGYLECNKGFRLCARFDIWLERDSACYHVRGHDTRLNNRLFWDSFDTLSEARKAFHKRLREWHCQRKIPTESSEG